MSSERAFGKYGNYWLVENLKNHRLLIQENEQWKLKEIKFQERNRNDTVQLTSLPYDKVTNVTSKSSLLSKRYMFQRKKKRVKQSTKPFQYNAFAYSKEERTSRERTLLFLILSLFIHLPISFSLDCIIYKVYIKYKNRNIP